MIWTCECRVLMVGVTGCRSPCVVRMRLQRSQQGKPYSSIYLNFSLALLSNYRKLSPFFSSPSSKNFSIRLLRISSQSSSSNFTPLHSPLISRQMRLTMAAYRSGSLEHMESTISWGQSLRMYLIDYWSFWSSSSLTWLQSGCSIIIIIRMGCNVVSVYNDEVIGKIGYPQLVLDDLCSRDYRTLCFLPAPKPLQSNICSLYGFTQSFTTSRLFVVSLKNKEHIVYTAGRIIVLFQPLSQAKILIANPDYICSFMVLEKLCVVGLNGGTVLLWDLEFQEIKLEILLPQNSESVSTAGLSHKYIFVTDSSRPHNIAYVYDIRTGRLLAHGMLPSLQPLLKSISVGENLHVAAAADGIWFMRLVKLDKQVQIVRGMFGRFPKTSMLCVASFGHYLVSGGVDGYVYIWLSSTYQCLKAIKVADCEITALGVKNKQIIVATSQGRVKVYTFQIMKKKQNQMGSSGEEEPSEEVSFIMIDSYLEAGQAIALCGSQADKYLYFCITREGHFFKKTLPAPSSDKKLLNPQLLNNTYLQKFASIGKFAVTGNTLYSYYNSKDKSSISVDIFTLENHSLKLKEERQLALKQVIVSEQMDYSPVTHEVCYVTKGNKVMVGLSIQKGIETIQESSIAVVDIQNQQILAINYVHSEKVLLCVTTKQTIIVFQRDAKLKYREKCCLKYENQLPEILKIDDQELLFKQQCKQWKLKGQTWKPVEKSQIEQLKIAHCGDVSSRDDRWSQKKLSCGQGFAIFWKN